MVHSVRLNADPSRPGEPVVVVIDRLKAAPGERYQVEGEIGVGGMATVFLATDLRHDRRVAVTVLRPELAAVLGSERFLSEIRAEAKRRPPRRAPTRSSGSSVITRR